MAAVNCYHGKRSFRGLSSLLLLFVATSTYILNVDAHGHMSSPRSRNWYAKEKGVDGSGVAGKPPTEYCSHCLNLNDGVCGKSPYNNYDNYVDSNGNPMPWISEVYLVEEQTIVVKSYLDTHHNGHMEIRACALGPLSTQECFNTPGHELTFVSDVLYNMPKDVNYPERGYYAGGQGGSLKDFEFEFKLPKGIYGDQVMLQWKYITANSCSPPGYNEYFTNNSLPSSYWTPGLGLCTPPYPNDGARGTTYPEQFFNCAEVSIVASAPTVSPQPSPVPSTASPTVTKSPTHTPVVVPTQAPAMSNGCCSQNLKDCVTWCGSTKAECDTCTADVAWIQGPQTECSARWDECTNDPYSCCPGLTCLDVNAPYYMQCEYIESATTTVSPVTTTSATTTAGTTTGAVTTSAPPITTVPGTTAMTTSAARGCCSINFKTCHHEEGTFCWLSQENCVGPCGKYWLPTGNITGCTAQWDPCVTDEECCGPAICDTDNVCRADGWSGTPAPTPSPVIPATPAPVVPGTPAPVAPTSTASLSCSAGAGTSTWTAMQAMDGITHEVSAVVLSVLASGGAAGDGSYVVTESQAYGILTSALTLVSLDESDVEYDEAKLTFEGYFNGWKKMCENSNPPPCQSPTYCNGGQWPCLPGWKHSGDLSHVVGTGAAPDGDEDAIAGMIIALKAVENDSLLPSWYDEVADWADRSCTQFLADNTVLSSSGSHRLLKLGTCWGGWDGNGNNPSYHAPGHWRMMRDFQASYGQRSYSLPNLGDALSWTEKWNMLIDTSYKFLETTQCSSTGLVPNWALVQEVDTQNLAKYSGSFSGSGTPQYEFGSEASRTMWRVVFDAILYPDESVSQADTFLSPLLNRMVQYFDPDPTNEWEYFGHGTLSDCSNEEGYVSGVFGSWQWNGFIFGPIYSTLVLKMAETTFEGKSFTQQHMVDAACNRVDDQITSLSYYPRSWQVIAAMTLNGELNRARQLFGTATSAPVAPATPAPVSPVTPSPAPGPVTPAPVSPVTPAPAPSGQSNHCCSWDQQTCGSDSFCNGSQDNCEGSCNGSWIDPSTTTNCIADWQSCMHDQTGCCGGSSCVAYTGHMQCEP